MPAGLTNDQQRLDILFAILKAAEAEIFLPDSQCNGVARRYLEMLCRNSWDELPTSLKAWIEHFCRENITHSAGVKQAFVDRQDQNETEQDYLRRLFAETSVQRQALGDALFYRKSVRTDNTSLMDQLHVCLQLGLSGNVKRLYLKAEQIIREIDKANQAADRLKRQAAYWYRVAADYKRWGLTFLAEFHSKNAQKLSTRSRSVGACSKAREIAKQFILHRINHDHYMPPKEHERLLRFLQHVLQVPKNELPPVWSSDVRVIDCYSNEKKWREHVKSRAITYWPDATEQEVHEQLAAVDGKIRQQFEQPRPVSLYTSFEYTPTSPEKLQSSIAWDPASRWRVGLQLENTGPDGRKMAMQAMPGTRDVSIDATGDKSDFWRRLTGLHQATAELGTKDYRHTHVPFDMVNALERFKGYFPAEFTETGPYSIPAALVDDIVIEFLTLNFNQDQKIRNSSQDHVLVESCLQSLGLRDIKRGELGQARRGLVEARHVYTDPEKQLEFDMHFSARLLQALATVMEKPAATDRRMTRFDYNVGALKKIIKALSANRLRSKARQIDVNFLKVADVDDLIAMLKKLQEFGLEKESLYALLSYASGDHLQALVDKEGFSKQCPVIWTEAFLVLCDKHKDRSKAFAVINKSPGLARDGNLGKAFHQVADLPAEARGEVEARIEGYFHEYAAALHAFKEIVSTKYDPQARRMLEQLGSYFLPYHVRENVSKYLFHLIHDKKLNESSSRRVRAAVHLLQELKILQECDLFKAVFCKGSDRNILETVWTAMEVQDALDRKATDAGRHCLAVSRLKVENGLTGYLADISGYSNLFYYAFAFVNTQEEAIELAPYAFQVVKKLNEIISSKAMLDSDADTVSSQEPVEPVISRRLVLALGHLAVKAGNASCAWTLFWYRLFHIGNNRDVYHLFTGTIRAHGERLKSRASSRASSDGVLSSAASAEDLPACSAPATPDNKGRNQKYGLLSDLIPRSMRARLDSKELQGFQSYGRLMGGRADERRQRSSSWNSQP